MDFGNVKERVSKEERWLGKSMCARPTFMATQKKEMN